MNNPITVTDVVEYTFCPKFTYYGLVLGLKQYEEKRGTVMAGRQMHSRHEKINLAYLPQHMEGKKLTSLKFYSKKYNLAGKIDEAIETDNEVVLIERKYSDNAIIGSTLKVQIGLLAILIEENIHKPVRKAIIIFSKKKREQVIVKIDQTITSYALKMLYNTKKVMRTGLNPSSKFDSRCLNCCYRKICPVGSLNTR